MTGEKANKIYISIILGTEIELDDEEEKEYYRSLKEEIETEKVSGAPIQWAVPSE